MNCRFGDPEYEDETLGTYAGCFESSLNSETKLSKCYIMECDRENRQIKVQIKEKTIICNGTKNIMIDPEGFKGNLTCPDYNMVCTSETWCNNYFECIEWGFSSDNTTYDYISNREELKERDKINLLVNDSLKFGIEEDNKHNNSKENDNDNNDSDNDDNNINLGNNNKFIFPKLVKQIVLFIFHII